MIQIQKRNSSAFRKLQEADMLASYEVGLLIEREAKVWAIRANERWQGIWSTVHVYEILAVLGDVIYGHQRVPSRHQEGKRRCVKLNIRRVLSGIMTLNGRTIGQGMRLAAEGEVKIPSVLHCEQWLSHVPMIKPQNLVSRD